MNKSIILAAATISLTLPAIPASAQVDQHTALKTILANNKSLKALDLGRRSQTVAARQATQLQGPEVEGEYLFGKTSDQNRWGLTVSQGFDWPGAYSARRRAIDKQEEADRAQVVADAMNVVLDARTKMIEGVYVQSQLDVLNKLKANLDTIAADIEKGYANGQYNLLDLKKIRFESFDIATRLDEANSRLTDIRASLNALNGGQNIDVNLTNYYPEALESLDTYLAQINNDPAVIAAETARQAAIASSDAAKKSRLPGFSLGYRHQYEDGQHFNGLTVGVTIPSWGSRNYESLASQLLAESLVYETEAQTATAAASTRALHQRTAKEKSLMAGYHHVMLDDNYPSLLLMAYKGGQINVITYIQEVNYYLTSRLDYITLEYQYRADLATLNRYSTLYSL
jgi:outer membrane protein TolC